MLWQRPCESYNESYDSRSTDLQMERYTNHSVRAMSITELDNLGIDACHILRASEHNKWVIHSKLLYASEWN